jgi:Ser/Thr protein kinase RdoA (MazF antagonist)
MIFSEAAIQDLVKEHYGLNVTVKALNGYDELNFLLSNEKNEKYILKVSNESHPFPFLEAQINIIQHLKKSPVSSCFQHFSINKYGEELTKIVGNSQTYYIRILNFLEGVFWVDEKAKTKELQYDLGSFLGKMDHALQDFSHPAMHRNYTWDISRASEAADNLKYILNHEKRRIAGYFLLQFDTEVLPQLHRLRHAYVHNDANDWLCFHALCDVRLHLPDKFQGTFPPSMPAELVLGCKESLLNLLFRRLPKRHRAI